MTDPVTTDTARAEHARVQLLHDIRQLKKMGNQMIQKTETAMHKAPVLLGLGVVGVALVGVAVFAGSRKHAAYPGWHRERSFLAEAMRSAALSALGILSGRITQRLLTAAMSEGAPR